LFEVRGILLNKPHVALLPGLDGTGELFDPVIPVLEKHFEIHVVRYTDEHTFDDYVDSALAQLPEKTPLSLVAESFSGPIAITLLADKALDFRASVLSATFCSSPLPFLTRLSKYLPEKFFSSNPVSKMLLDFCAAGGDADPELRKKALALLEAVDPVHIQNRIKLVNELDVTEKVGKIDVPLLYIRASKDRVVPARSGAAIMKHAKELKIKQVRGWHMILQTQPEKCAALIVDHVMGNTEYQSKAAGR
jgi:pimeloyl-ACP methyl ester carboxylesterase